MPLVALAAVAAGVLSNDGSVTARTASTGVAVGTSDDTVQVSCSSGVADAARFRRGLDIALGPLVLTGGRRWARSRPNAFDRRGFKVPATLPNGVVATLRVPAAERGRLGLVFTYRAQDRVEDTDVRGADTSVRFTACPAREEAARTGWPGGLVVNRRRCVTLVVKVAGGPSVRRRVPLGRRC